MNKKLLDNYDKMVVKEKVAVIHCAFGDTPQTVAFVHVDKGLLETCLLYTSPSPRDVEESRMPSSA